MSKVVGEEETLDSKHVEVLQLTLHYLLSQFESGLDIESKSDRVVNYVKALEHDFTEIISAMGCKSVNELGHANIYDPTERAVQ